MIFNIEQVKEGIANLIDPVSCEGCTLCSIRTNPCIFQKNTANQILSYLATLPLLMEMEGEIPECPFDPKSEQDKRYGYFFCVGRLAQSGYRKTITLKEALKEAPNE